MPIHKMWACCDMCGGQRYHSQESVLSCHLVEFGDGTQACMLLNHVCSLSILTETSIDKEALRKAKCYKIRGMNT